MASTLDDAVRREARFHHPDLYLSALLAPRAVRDDLIVLAAYVGEVRRIPLTVREPGLGLIRLQWWRDLIEPGNAPGETGAPVADALLGVMRRCRLPLNDVLAPLDAAEVMFSDGPIDDDAFIGVLNGTGCAPFRLAACLLNAEHSPAEADILHAAGQAYGAVLLAHDLPYHAQMGRWPVPAGFVAGVDDPHVSEAAAQAAARAATFALVNWGRDRLAAVRRGRAKISPVTLSAVRPAALFEPYSQALQRPGRDPLRDISGLSPLRRVVGLWLAHLRSRF